MGSYLGLIKMDLKIVKLIKNETDEAALNMTCYHIQQAIEKLCKYSLMEHGVEPPFTHDIDELIESMKQNDVNIPDWLEDYTGTLLKWATQSRRKGNFSASIRTIELPEKMANDWADSFPDKEITEKIDIF